MLRSFTRAYEWVEGCIPDAVWIDLVNPSDEEKLTAEKLFGIKIPTPAKVQEIEVSSRLYEENDSLFMTATVPIVDGHFHVRLEFITFILSHSSLLTLRDKDFSLRDAAHQRVRKIGDTVPVEAQLFLLSLGVIVDDIADLLERLLDEIDILSKEIFHRHDSSLNIPQGVVSHSMTRIGVCGESVLFLRESLVGLGRLVGFVSKERAAMIGTWGQNELATIEKDILALTDHVAFASNRISFLLNAILGFVNIRQNDIIKILSVVSVILLPPTLFASLWGMNFSVMPELSWSFGYPVALAIIITSGIVPYLYCKKNKWL